MTAGTASVAAGLAAFEDLRFWVTPSEHEATVVGMGRVHDATALRIEQLAAQSCRALLDIKNAERRGVKRDLIMAEQKKNVDWARSMKEQLRQIDEEIRQIKAKCGMS